MVENPPELFFPTNDWRSFFEEEVKQDYFARLVERLVDELEKYSIFPDAKNIFRAFELTPFEKVKVVLLGQDPYHGEGQAHGLCFSVPEGMKLPPSLKNIFKELVSDLGVVAPGAGDLSHWATEGVLLLNTVLSVIEKSPGSHACLGWEILTEKVIEKINVEKDAVVFILWGSYAISYEKKIDQTKHLVLSAPHPSPLSSYRGFFGSKPFSKSNAFLISKNKNAVDWELK